MSDRSLVNCKDSLDLCLDQKISLFHNPVVQALKNSCTLKTNILRFEP